MSDRKNVAVIAPHMDDEVLGMGGTIAKHVEMGDRVTVCIVAHRIYDHAFDPQKNEKEIRCALQAQKVLGYQGLEMLNLNDERLDVAVQDTLKPLEGFLEKSKPEIVYSNFFGDNHQDHRAVFQAVRVAVRPFASCRVKEWYLYETPSSTDQSPPISTNVFLPNFFVDVTDTLSRKIQAVNCYETEKRIFPHPRSEEAIVALAMKRGSEIGFSRAEAFMTMRRVWG